MVKKNVRKTGAVSYSFWIGAWKSLKNCVVVIGSGLVPFLLEHYTEWVPEKYLYVAGFIFAFIGYMIKNKFEFKG
jgi:hypothetical protein